MKRIKRLGIVAITSLLAISLSGCEIFDGILNPSTSENSVNSSTDNNTSSDSSVDFKFGFETDDKLTYSQGQEVYMLELDQGEQYQITAKYESDKSLEVKYLIENGTAVTVSASGLVKAKDNLPDGGSAVIRSVLVENDIVLANQYIATFVRGENQNKPRITFNDGNLTLDNQGNYCLSRNGGESYTFRCGYENAPQGFSIEYSIADPSDAAYCSITKDGKLTTKDDFYGTKAVTIKVEMFDANGNVIASANIIVTIVNPNEPQLSEFKVFNRDTNAEIIDNSEVTMFIEHYATFIFKMDGADVDGTITVNSEYAEVHNNYIYAIKVGATDIVFSAKDSLNRDYSITAKLVISTNSLVELYAPNGGNDSIILNGELITNGLYAKYADGSEWPVYRDNPDFSYSIGETVNENYKNVTFSYTKDGITKTVTYPVLVSNPNVINKTELGFNYKDYGHNYGGVNYGFNYVNSTGNINALIMPIWFTDSGDFFETSQKEQLVEDINAVMFGQLSDGIKISVKDYYDKASHGKLNITGDITDFYESTRQAADFSDEESSTTYNFATEAIRWYMANYSDKPIANYDADNNGKVDVAIFLFAGNYYGRIGYTNSYAYNCVFQMNDAGVGVHQYLDSCIFAPIGAFYGFELKTASNTHQKTMTDLSKQRERDFQYASEVLIHEMGHSLGCVDLYTQNGNSMLYPDGGYEPTGKTTIMNSYLETMDPFESNVLGWSEPYVLSADDYNVGESFNIQLNDYQDSGENIILTPSWNAKNSPFDEYMQLELYTPEGLYGHSENYVVDTGVRLWHINAALEQNNNGKTGYYPSDGGTSMIASNHLETEEDFDIVHLIRNNKEEEYKSKKVFSSEDLFKTGDLFVLEDYQSQFKNGPMFDNRNRLGWSFSVKSIFRDEDYHYSCIIHVTRVDKTIINFAAQTNLDKVSFTQPETDGVDYANDILGSDDDLSLIYNFNDSTELSYTYEQRWIISSKGICLFSATSGKGGSLVISIKDKEGKQVLIKKVTVTYNLITNATLTGLVDGEAITPTQFTGPMSTYCDYNDKGLIFDVNAKTFTLQNQYTGTVDHHSLVAITSLVIDYSII